jgi:hypothetical protein
MGFLASFIELGLFILLAGWVAWALFYPVRKNKNQRNEKK